MSSYVILVDFDGDWCDAPMAEKMERWLTAHDWDVEIRKPRRGEIVGTYKRTNNGLQILGASFRVPEELQHAIREAWNASIKENGQ